MYNGMLYLKQGEVTDLAIKGFRALGIDIAGNALTLDCGGNDGMDHGRAIVAIATIRSAAAEGGGASPGVGSDEIGTAAGTSSVRAGRSATREFDQQSVRLAVERALEDMGFSKRNDVLFYFDPGDGITAHASVRIPAPNATA